VEEGGNTRFKKGDRVIAFPKAGSYAEYAAVKEDLVFLLPDGISMEQAAAMPTVSILAYLLLHDISQVTASDTIVIHSAAGGVGSMLTQFAKLYGVQKIITTVGDLKKADYVKELGADVVCHYDVFVEKVLEETEGKGATIIFDSVAGDITQKSLTCLANYGTLVQFGNSSGKTGQILTTEVHSSCRNVKGFSLGTTRKEDPKRLAPAAEKVFDYLLTGKVDIPIEEIFELKDVRHAHQRMESRIHQGKILLKL
jgi:NADPH:quinone reductase